MKLINIDENICCICGSKVVSESCRHTHTNGQGFEEREFSCGRRVKWSPNFGRLEAVAPCPKDVDVVLMEKKRVAARNALIIFINDFDVDEKWKADKRSRI